MKKITVLAVLFFLMVGQAYSQTRKMTRLSNQEKQK